MSTFCRRRKARDLSLEGNVRENTTRCDENKNGRSRAAFSSGRSDLILQSTFFPGGALVGIRTPNLLIRSQMLYPLSYERSVSCADSAMLSGPDSLPQPGIDFAPIARVEMTLRRKREGSPAP